MSDDKERIIAVAIKLNDGAVDSMPPPNRHHDLLLCIGSEYLTDHVQGFKTSTGRFVTREEAYPIAKAAGQLLPQDRPGHTPTPGTLYTEDLW